MRTLNGPGRQCAMPLVADRAARDTPWFDANPRRMSPMSSASLGRIERLDPREIWKSEPYDFTPWLKGNIDELGRALGLEIDVNVQQEVAVGLFSADLLGTDVGTSAGILVENQLQQTHHTHLGQVITYAAGLGTDIVVWVSTKG